MDKINFKPGDKFILELGERRLDEYEIARTDLYVKIYLLKKLTPYNPEVVSLTAEPERKGQWIKLDKDDDVFDLKGVHTWGIRYECPFCYQEHTVIEDFGQWSFCPNCGADMRGE